MLARNAEDLASTPLRLARRLESAILHPRPAARQIAESAEAIGEVAWALANPAPEVPLNTEIGSHRRFEWVRGDLATLKRIKDALGGTVNDVVLAVVAGALRRWLHSRGIRTEGLELRALVPMSIRAEDEHGQLGNRIAAMRGPLPVYIADPVRRLEAVRESMQGREVLEAGARGGGDLALQRLRPADPARAGLAAQLLHSPVQPDRYQRPRPADPALRPRPRARGHLPGRLPAREPRSRDRDHELQRLDRLRPARRLRRDGGRRTRSPRGSPRRSPSSRPRPREPRPRPSPRRQRADPRPWVA